MEYTTEITIAAPREKVVELFTNPARFSEWQPGLERYEFISGAPFLEGAKAELTTRTGSRTMEMTETIASNSLPDELVVVYETDGVWNRNVNRFIAESPSTTRWVLDNELRFHGARKAFALLKSSFEKESLETMESFKAVIEGDAHVGALPVDQSTQSSQR